MMGTIKTLFRHKRFILGFVLFVMVLLFGFFGPIINSRNPFDTVGGLFTAPSDKYILGTDNLGRDVFTELMHGTKTSLIIGFLGGIIATLIGVTIGAVAGYKGGTVEEVLMGFTNVVITIPTIVILILLSIAIKTRSLETMALIIGVTSWPWTARAVRAQASSLRTREHIDLAKISGFRSIEIIILDVIPYMFSYIAMAFILQFASGIMNEATLSMLGLGPFNTISLGVMLHWSLLWESVRVGAWWAFIPPVLFLSLTTFSLMCMNSSMDEIFNPRLRRS